MKEFLIKDLSNFLTIANSIDSVFKFFESNEKQTRAEIWLRTALITWEGQTTEEVKSKLKENGFSEAELRETRKVWLTDLFE